MSYIAFVDTQGRLVFGMGCDLQEGKPIPLPDSFKKLLAPASAFLKHNAPADVVSGIAMLPEAPLLMVSRPIVTSENKGPIRGTLVMAREFSSDLVKQFSKRTKLDVGVFRYDAEQAPADVMSMRQALSPTSPAIIRPIDDAVLAGYTPSTT